jgi:hypothetical protein
MRETVKQCFPCGHRGIDPLLDPLQNAIDGVAHCWPYQSLRAPVVGYALSSEHMILQKGCNRHPSQMWWVHLLHRRPLVAEYDVPNPTLAEDPEERGAQGRQGLRQGRGH